MSLSLIKQVETSNNQNFSQARLKEFLESSTSLERLIIVTYLNLIKFFDGETEASQIHVAYKCGTTRETVNRTLARAAAAGILTKIYRHRHTCIYYFKPWYFNHKLRKFFFWTYKKLKPIKRRLLYIPVATLMLNTLTASGPVTPIVKFKNKLSILVQIVSNPDPHIEDKTSIISKIRSKYGGSPKELAKIQSATTETIKDSLYHLSRVTNVRDPINYLIVTIINISKDKHEHLDWPKFFRQYPSHANDYKSSMLRRKAMQDIKERNVNKIERSEINKTNPAHTSFSIPSPIQQQQPPKKGNCLSTPHSYRPWKSPTKTKEETFVIRMVNFHKAFKMFNNDPVKHKYLERYGFPNGPEHAQAYKDKTCPACFSDNVK